MSDSCFLREKFAFHKKTESPHISDLSAHVSDGFHAREFEFFKMFYNWQKFFFRVSEKNVFWSIFLDLAWKKLSTSSCFADWRNTLFRQLDNRHTTLNINKSHARRCSLNTIYYYFSQVLSSGRIRIQTVKMLPIVFLLFVWFKWEVSCMRKALRYWMLNTSHWIVCRTKKGDSAGVFDTSLCLLCIWCHD